MSIKVKTGPTTETTIVRVFAQDTEQWIVNFPDGSEVFSRPLITFNLNYTGGGTWSTQRRTYEVESITNPGNPTRSGYTFKGWYTSPSGGTKLTFP